MAVLISCTGQKGLRSMLACGFSSTEEVPSLRQPLPELLSTAYGTPQPDLEIE